MPSRLTLSLFAFAMLAALAAVPAGAQNGTVGHWQCPDPRVAVAAPSAASARIVCGQADKAHAFLAQCGITGRHALTVRIARELAAEPASSRAGHYDPATSSARLIPLSAYMRIARPRFGSTRAMARELHASIAAHEVAHGIFHEHAAALDLPETAHEYVAYVVQLSTLPLDVRKHILEQNEVPQVANLFTFSFFLLRADPELYALNAFRHFHQPENGCAFIHSVLAGRVHFPPPSD
jgi:hypothetical protein